MAVDNLPVLSPVLGQEELYKVPSKALGVMEGERPPGSTTGQYITPESTVSGQMMDLLSTDSPYLRQADIRAKEEAQSKGLLSSSMAVGATERERIKAALPIAQQDAQLYGTSALKEQDFANTSALDSQRTAGQGVLQRQGYTESSALSGQDADQNIDALNEQARLGLISQTQAEGAASTLQAEQGEIQLGIEEFSQGATDLRQQNELDLKERLTGMEMDTETANQYLTSSTTLGNQFSDDVAAVLASDSVTKNEDIAHLEQVYMNNMNFLAGAAGINPPLDWTGFEEDVATETTPGGATDVAKLEADKIAEDKKDREKLYDVIDAGGAGADWAAEELGINNPTQIGLPTPSNVADLLGF